MTDRRAYPPTVTVSAAQVGGHVILDYFEYRAKAGGLMKRASKQTRVMIRHDEDLDAAQLLSLVSRMCAYLLARTPVRRAVPRHLPWREVGATEWSVPPGGGEGGAKPGPVPGVTERGM